MEIFLTLSIRARVAYGILCLEQTLQKLGYDYNRWQFLLDTLWSYTYSNPGAWHMITAEITPLSIMGEGEYNTFDFECITSEQYSLLKRMYSTIPKEYFVIFELIFEIGTKDLYASIVNGSKETHGFLATIVKVLEENKIEVPDIPEFLMKQSIDENYGWGNPFYRKDIFDA